MASLASWRENMPLRLTRRDVNTQRGITLIELLVALVIVAVLSAAAVLAIPDFGARRAEVTAERFTALLGRACERAEVSGRDMGEWKCGGGGKSGEGRVVRVGRRYNKKK